MRLVFDIESEGVDFQNPAWIFNDEPKVITVICAVDRDDPTRMYTFRHDAPELCNGSIEDGLKLLARADWLGGHNIHGFDLPYIQACFPNWKPKPGCIIRDSKVESEMWYPAHDLRSKDFVADKARHGKWIDKRLFGRHSLEAWGQRIGKHLKDDFKNRVKEETSFDPWSDTLPEPYATERAEYCLEDVLVNLDLFEYLENKFPYEAAARAVEIENRVARILVKQTQWGVAFDSEGARKLHAEIMRHKLRIERELTAEFHPFYLRDGKAQYPKRTMKRRQPDGWIEYRHEGEPFVKVKRVEFNPGSRMHIANRLMRMYGWKPTEFTDNGEPKVDETVLAGLPYPPCKKLNQYLMIEKRLGQLAQGKEAWLYHERYGRIHGRVNQNGTRTTRASHASPNMGQVPKVKKKSGLDGGWGAEMRALFGPRPGRKQVGIDLSGIELRALGHYMAAYDGGVYADLVVNGDVHTATKEVIQFNSRDVTKTAEYAYLYGAGDYKLGLITFEDMTSEQRAEFGKVTRGKLTALGKATRNRLMQGLNGMERLVKACHAAAQRGWMKALDGRHISAGSKHASLNTLLQHLGGLLAKRWMVECEDRFIEQGLIEADSWIALPTDKVVQILWVHDELQHDCLPEVTELVASIAIEAADAAGKYFDLRVKVDAEAKIGNNWRECH